jgi:hypothetical protein
MSEHGKNVLKKPSLAFKLRARSRITKTDETDRNGQLPVKPQSEPAVTRKSETETDATAIGTLLVSDIISLFNARNVSKMKTKRLLACLCTDQEKPWATFCSGQNLNSRKLSSLLKEFSIHSKDIRFKSGVVKGYRKEWFKRAIRHLKDINATKQQP